MSRRREQLQTISEASTPRTRPGLPRLLAEAGGGPMRSSHHFAVHGELPQQQRRRRRSEHPLIEQAERAGLRGRGGAGFPLATKMRAVAAQRRRPLVVVNATEGEPASRKDRALCELTPHLILDGALLAAAAVRADEAIVCVCESALGAYRSIVAAIAEREDRDARSVKLRACLVPAGYVSGQESALVNHLNGAQAIPTFTPPMSFEQGVRRRPTLVNNAETLAQLALIARHGPDWYRALGTTTQPGSTLVTLSGPVASPGVYEIEYGASLSSLIDAAGGITTRVRAALLGGYAGAWIDGQLLRGVALSDEHLAVHDASIGAGVVLLLSEEACPVAETARVARWMAQQSARQCGPCLNGLAALAAAVEEIARGAHDGNPAMRIERLASLTRRRGACAHPDGAVRFILSSYATFGVEFADHARHGACDACLRRSELPLTRNAREPRTSPPRQLASR
ncbi:MAG TPA: NADH-ubiquinone oxidoreductase-F iron-sulfur binding region domain-containing protein [Solirubrobacteraceae bacterium]|jgi:NADH:ubiquinone oxidoreductase subunit F (NADH-binding)